MYVQCQLVQEQFIEMKTLIPQKGPNDSKHDHYFVILIMEPSLLEQVQGRG